MIWIKYRHEFAEGPGDWEAMPINLTDGITDERKDECVKNYVHELREVYSWSEHYRGVTWEYWTPTDTVLDAYEKKVKGDIASLETELSTLKAYRESLNR